MIRCLLLLLVLLPAHVLAAPAPQLTSDEPVFDFGTVLQGEKVDHTFVFRNSGTAPLVIDRVKSSCSCTASLLSDKEIPAGGSGSVQAVFDSTRFRGRIHKTLYLYSNDPDRPSVEFLLQGEVVVPLQATPATLNFGDVAVGAQSVQTVVLKNTSPVTLLIDNISSLNDAVQVDWQEVKLAAGAQVSLTIKAVPQAATPNLNGKILVHTNNPSIPEFAVPVSGSVLRP